MVDQVPAKRSSSLDVARRDLANYFRKMTRMQTVSRTYGANVVGGECFAAFHVSNHKKRAPKYAATLFHWAETEMHSTKSLLGNSDCIDCCLELFWFKRESAVGSGVRTRESDVLLDDTSAKRHCGDRDSRSQRVIRQTRWHLESLRQLRNRSKIHFFRRCRIGARALQQRDLSGSRITSRVDCLVDLFNCCHPGRHNQRLAGLCHFPNERDIDQLERSYFVRGNPHSFEEVHRGCVKGTRKTVHAQAIRN